MKKATIMSTAFIVSAVAIEMILVSIVNHPSVIFAQQQTNKTSTTMKSGLIANNTIIGNTIIPSTTNGTTTTAKNATGTNATGVNPELLASNVTAANALTKENTTAPVSPTGMSTNSAHAPPSVRENASSVNK